MAPQEISAFPPAGQKNGENRGERPLGNPPRPIEQMKIFSNFLAGNRTSRHRLTMYFFSYFIAFNHQFLQPPVIAGGLRLVDAPHQLGCRLLQLRFL